jgi:predicted nucleic acid-binding protein
VAVVLDSDAVIGFLDADDALHDAADAAIRELVRTERLLVSVVTYAEVLTGARLGHHGEEYVSGFFTKLISELLPVEVEVAARAAELRATSKSLRMPDALTLATAETHSEVEMVVTGDAEMTKLPDFGCAVRQLR